MEEVKEIECCETTHVHKEKVKVVKASLPSEDDLIEVAELFKVFGDSTRTRIIATLFERELCVCDICSLLKMTKSAISHQLRVLRQAKLVKCKKVGKEVYYSLSDKHIEKIYKMAIEHIKE